MQPNEFADLVVLTVKNAQAPLLERLAVFEQSNRELQARVAEFAAVRDRLTVVETKAAIVPQQVVSGPTKTDVELMLRDRFDPMVQKAVELEQRLSAIGESAQLTALKAGERGIDGKDGGQGPKGEKGDKGDKGEPDASAAVAMQELRDRFAVLDSKSTQLEAENTKLRERLIVLEARQDPEPLTKELSLLRERVGIVEVRAQVPGPPGKDGRDGVNGKNGADGFSLKDFSVDLDADRTMVLSFEDETLKKSWPIRLPFMRQEGVYLDGKSYSIGDVVTWGGSQWHCNEDTSTKPGDGSKAWTLIVKRGRDGKDGKDAVTVPVVSVARA